MWLSRRIVIPFAVLLSFVPRLVADKLVSSHSSATSQYLARRPDGGPQKIETYVFAEGRYWEGNERAPSLEKMPFLKIASILAEGLQKRAYLPAKSVDEANLLLVVHWGVTRGAVKDPIDESRKWDRMHELFEDYNNRVEIEKAQTFDDPQPSSHAIASEIQYENMAWSPNEVTNSMRNMSYAQLLGFTSGIQVDAKRPFGGDNIADLLEDARYFVILVAYDCEKLSKEKKWVRLWTTRLSIRSAGVNFATAMRRMTQVGSLSFGTSAPTIQLLNAEALKADISLGQIKVIRFEDGASKE